MVTCTCIVQEIWSHPSHSTSGWLYFDTYIYVQLSILVLNFSHSQYLYKPFAYDKEEMRDDVLTSRSDLEPRSSSPNQPLMGRNRPGAVPSTGMCIL